VEVLASFFSSVFTIEPGGDLPLMHHIEVKQECIEKTCFVDYAGQTDWSIISWFCLVAFLNSAVMFPSFHSLGTKPWHIDELNIVVIGFDIVALSSFSILG
jgi:hypothetical protein